MSEVAPPGGQEGRRALRLEEALDLLEKAERRLDEVQRIAGVGYWELDVETLDMEWSAEVYQLLGLRRGTLPETLSSVLECAVPEDRSRVVDSVRRVVDGGVMDVEWRARHPTRPGLTVLRGRGRRLPSEDGARARVAGTIRNLTEVRQAEAPREEARRAAVRNERLATLGTVVAGIAHEFNNPLMFIQGNLELAQASLDDLQQEAPHPALGELRHKIETASRGLDQIVQLTRGLKMITQEKPSRQRGILLADVLDQALALARPRLPPQLRLELDLRTRGPVWADDAAMCRVLVNLLVNAAEAMAAERSPLLIIRMRMDELDEHVELTLEDNGHGLSVETQAHLFTPFFTTKPNGTGLGLTLSAATVHTHSGSLTLETAPGGGAVCRLRLPAAEATSLEDTPPAGPAGPPISGAAWRHFIQKPGPHQHLVHLYEDERRLETTVLRWILSALRGDGRAALICTEEHRQRVFAGLRREGVDPDGLVASGRLIIADAEKTLGRIMRDGGLDPAAVRVVLDEFRSALAAQPTTGEVRAWGEMVDLLWRQGRGPAAQALESLWCEWLDSHRLRMLCSYRESGSPEERARLASMVDPTHSLVGRD